MHPYRQSVEETDVSDSSDAEDREGLGDKIFSLVEELDPLHANDITGELTLTKYAESSVNECPKLLTCICVGMLLEMDQAALRQLICDRKMLDVAVRKAQAALNNHK